MTNASDRYSFLPGKGEVSALIARYPWGDTPLGALEAWPQTLRSSVSLMLGSPVPMALLWGREGILLYNDAYAELSEQRHPKLLGLPVAEGWPEVAEFTRHALTEGLAGRTLSYRNQEMTLHRKGRPEQVWLNLDYSPVLDEHGIPVGVLAVHYETTEELMAERRLKGERRMLFQMFSQAPGMMALLSGPEHCFELANPAYLQWIGDREIIGKPLREALPEIEAQGFITVLDDVYKSGETFVAAAGKVLLARRANEPLSEFYVDFVFQPITDAHGVVTGIFIEGFDVTDRERTAAALRQSEELFETLVNNIPQMAWMTEEDLSTFWFNQRWYDYTGATPEQMQNRGWMDILHPEHFADAERVREEKKPWMRNFRLRGADGTFNWFLTQAIPIFDETGRLRRWFGTNTDITQMKRLQDELHAAAAELAEADQRKDEFIATMAHELRNPLAPILAGLDVMKMAADQPAMVEQVRQVIERQTRQLASLVDDLLDISRLKLSKLELRKSWHTLADVVNVAVDTSRPLIDAARHQLSVEVDSRIRLHIDAHRIAQVLSNLLNNAAKYTPDGGRISLRVERDADGVAILIRDSGVGISLESQHRIFELFSQLDRPLEKGYKGLGVGLTLARTLVEMHDGNIEVFSRGENAGSEFRVRLPTLAAEPVTEAVASLESPVHPHRILVVDDNAAAVETLVLLLKLNGHEVAEARDGLEGISRAETFRPQVVLMDIGMPGMNGYDAVRYLREQPWGKHILIIALTGWGQEDDRRRTQEAGFDHHLVKPLDQREFQRILAQESDRLTAI